MCARSAPERAAWLAALTGDDALFEAGAQLGASFEGVLDCSNGGATARRYVVLRGGLAVFYANEGDARAKRRAVGSCFLRGVREGDDGAPRPASSSVDGADCVRPSVGGARDAAWNSNLQPDFNVRVFLTQTLRLGFENSMRAIDPSKNQPNRLRCDRAREF